MRKLHLFDCEVKLELHSYEILFVVFAFLGILYLGMKQSFIVTDALVKEGLAEYSTYRSALFPPVMQVFQILFAMFLPVVVGVYSFLSTHRDISNKVLSFRLVSNSYAKINICRVAFCVILVIVMLMLGTAISYVMQCIWNSKHSAYAYLRNGTEILALAKKNLASLLYCIYSILLSSILGAMVSNAVIGIGFVIAICEFVLPNSWLNDIVSRCYCEANMFECITYSMKVSNFTNWQITMLSIVSLAALVYLSLVLYRKDNA